MKKRYNKNIYLLMFIIIILTPNINANQWSSYVAAGSSYWSIDRQSQSLNFDLAGSVEGNVSSITGCNGRNLTPYSSYYANIDENDVESRMRINALEGRYHADENVALISNVSNDRIDIYANKPVGSDIYTFSYYESWPILLIVNQSIEYSGKQINNRDFVSNNGDSVKNSVIYNKILERDVNARLWLENLSATVLATNDQLISANLHLNKSLDYETNIYTTGIADMRYRQSTSLFNPKRQNYFSASESRETYSGNYNITRKIHMDMGHSPFYEDNRYEWMPCCSGDLLSDQNGMSLETANNSCIFAQDENDADSWFKKGAAFIELGNYSEAIVAYEKFINISPYNASAWNQRGAALALMGRYNESIDSFKKATEIDRMYPVPWYNRGTTLAMIGRYDEAIQNYDEAIRIDPQEPGFWYAKGLALQALNRKDEAKIALDKAQEIVDAPRVL
jgi:tetratricopeptide (TPR) repeat protein